MRTKLAPIAAATLAVFTPAAAKEKAPRTWTATHTTDPVTGISRCVVSASDYVGKTRYTRTGFLYPVIENHPEHGLLVGVSSGGRFRLPTGAILWRVDDRPFREIRPEDGPGTQAAALPPPSLPEGTNPTAKAVNDAMATAMRMAVGMSATSTFATGDTAKAMLAELRAGKGLLYRAKAAAVDTGLPDNGAYRLGQVTNDGLKPLPLDASLAQALVECGIN